MDALLSVAFDNLASPDTSKTRKGLRQIEGLLAQICLSAAREAEASPLGKHNLTEKPHLERLTDDLAFQEFFRLQENFQWNVATRLINTLERLLGTRSTSQIEAMIHSALVILQGILLLHPPSRTFFSQENHMTLLLDLLDPLRTNPDSLIAALLVLQASLLERPLNIRLFEKLDGIKTIASIVQPNSPLASDQRVRAQCFECLTFYAMPEAIEDHDNVEAGTSTKSQDPLLTSALPRGPISSQRSPSKLSSYSSTGASSHKSQASQNSSNTDLISISSRGSGQGLLHIRTTATKWEILNAHLGHSDEIMSHLKRVCPRA